MTQKRTVDLYPSVWQQYKPFKSRYDNKQSVSCIIDDARKVANSIANGIVSKFGAKKVVLFGSLASGNFNRWSDIDLAVWGISLGLFYKAVAFASGSNKVWSVHLVDAEDCSDTLLEHILREGIEL